jgi:protein ImuA
LDGPGQPAYRYCRIAPLAGAGGSPWPDGASCSFLFGLDELDRSLPQGGLPLRHLHEVIEAGAASEHVGIATLFVAGILAQLSGPVLWCLRGRDLFAPTLARIGIYPDA